MVDCHMHMILDGVFWRDAIARHERAVDRPWIRAILERYRHDGYTYLRDGGDRWGAGAAAREMAEELGIRYRTPLAPLCKRGTTARSSAGPTRPGRSMKPWSGSRKPRVRILSRS